MSKTRILIADDHAVLRSGLKLLINSQRDLEVVGEAANFPEVFRQVRLLKPQVLTLDLSMPGGQAVDTLRELQKAAPDLKIVVLTMHNDPGLLRAAFAAGALAYVTKKAADTELLSAIRAVACGRAFANVELESRTEPHISLRRPADQQELSEREQSVLKLVAHGYTNQEVADQLDISVKTVETYRAKIMQKLKLETRADLVQYALATGLLRSPLSPLGE